MEVCRTSAGTPSNRNPFNSRMEYYPNPLSYPEKCSKRGPCLPSIHYSFPQQLVDLIDGGVLHLRDDHFDTIRGIRQDGKDFY